MTKPPLGRVSSGRVLLVASFGAFLAFLDATIVNVAFPSIRESFPEASIGALSWVLNAYNIVFAAFLVVCGRLTDVLGRRRAFVAGIVVFTAASLWCGLAGSLEVLVAGRVVQALGAALLVPASLALVVEAFPPARRSHAIGLWGATAAVAAGLGPPTGGALVELGDWRWAFFINIPFGIIAVVVARRELVESRAPGRRRLPDLPGAALLAICLGLLNLALVKAEDWGWLSAAVLGCLGGAALALAAFIRSSRAHPAPVVDPALVRLPAFRMASAATLVGGVGFYAYLLTNILWLQYVWGYDVLDAGLAMVPGALVAAVVAARLGPLAERVGYRAIVVPGALVWAGAFVWYHQRVGTDPAFWSEWMPGQVLSGIGVGATLPLLGAAALAAVPGGRYAAASALVSSARQVGGVLGIALLVLLLGEPTGPGVVDALRDGWLLCIGAFLAVAALASPVGRVAGAAPDGEGQDESPALLHNPGPALATRPTAVDAPVSLTEVPMLAGLSAVAQQRLLDGSREVVAPAGSWLVRAGDPPGPAYVVRRGRLEVLVDGVVVRELGPGAVIGELALLTGEARSADVRVRRDAAVLEIPRAAFDRVLEDDSFAARSILTQVAQQLRSATPPPVSGPLPAPRVIAVIGLHTGAPAAAVAASITEVLRGHGSVAQPARVDAESLDRCERENARVVLVADDDDDWRDFCLRQADGVVLVAMADSAPSRAPSPAPGRQPDLVLVGPVPAPGAMAEWAEAVDAWQVTVAADTTVPSVTPLADRLAGRSLGLVLAGGGARAFAHIGVIAELAAHGMRVDRVAGSSLGAIVAAAHATGRSPDELEADCYAEFVRRRPFNDWVAPAHSLARGRRTETALGRAFGVDTRIEGLPRQLHVVSTDLVKRTRVVHRRGLLRDAVVASARLPVLFAPVPTDDGRLLMDGGVLDNLPVDLLLERDEGQVVAVNISMGGGTRRPAGSVRPARPRVPALGETLLRTMMIGSAGAVDAARGRGVVVVTPPTLGVGLLEFHQFDQMVEAGRRAARSLLDAGALETVRPTEVDPDGQPPAEVAVPV